MTTRDTINATTARSAYAALRYGGKPPAAARAELGMDPGAGLRLERSFRRTPAVGGDPMRPKFARHELHVSAVLAQGGYPVLAERRR